MAERLHIPTSTTLTPGQSSWISSIHFDSTAGRPALLDDQLSH
jgi:hypothetical protein